MIVAPGQSLECSSNIETLRNLSVTFRKYVTYITSACVTSSIDLKVASQQVAQASLGTVNMTSRKSVIIRVYMGL